MDEMKVYYVDVLLPLHLPDTYTYRVPQELNGQVKVGARVVVQFGAKSARMYSAVVRRIHEDAPRWRSKYIMGVLDEEPIVTERQMEFWEWMARYYMCCPGDVMACALPSGLKLASESAVRIHPDFTGELSSLSKLEINVVQLLSEHSVMRVVDISRAIGVEKIMPLMRGMMEREIVVMDEELRERFKPRKSAYVVLNDASEENIKALFDELERKKRVKQVELLMQFMQLSHFGKEAVAKRELPQTSALQTLIKNGVLSVEERVESRLKDYSDAELTDPASIVLNEEQSKAFASLHSSQSTHLLHGVTSSGKTEVYIKMIDEVVKAGGQALFLLPEIALTAQRSRTVRIRKSFGDLIRFREPRSVAHAGEPPHESVDVVRPVEQKRVLRYHRRVVAETAAAVVSERKRLLCVFFIRITGKLYKLLREKQRIESERIRAERYRAVVEKAVLFFYPALTVRKA